MDDGLCNCTIDYCYFYNFMSFNPSPSSPLDSLTSLILSSPYNPSSTIQLFTPTLIASMLPLLPTPSCITLPSFLSSTLKLFPLSLPNRPKLTHSLFKLFQQICKTKDHPSFTFSQFTTFLSNKTPDLSLTPQIQQKVLPYNIEIDRNLKHRIKPPEVIGSSKHELRRLNPTLTNTDKLHHINRKIQKTCYSKGNKLFFVLDSPSRYIDVLDREYVGKWRLTTGEQMSAKEAVIISFDWSEATARIGCIFANYSTSFWALADEFKYQLNCPLPFSYIKHPPNKIFFLESQKKWIKLNNKPTIYILDDQNFQISDSFSHTKITKQDPTSPILLSQITYHKLLILAFQKSVFLISLSRKEITTSLTTPETNIYTLTFSETYQTLLLGCFSPHIYCYELSEFCDLSLKGKLLNNLEISTCLLSIPDTPIIVSVQDNSYVKLWNVCDCNSFQYFMTYKNLEVREMVAVENGVVLVGSKLLEFGFEEEKKESAGEYNALVDVWGNRGSIIAVGVHNVSVYNVETGWPERILKNPMQLSSILLSHIIPTQNHIILVTEDATLKIININDGETITSLSFVQKKPIALHYDTLSNIVSVAFEDEIQLLFYHQFEELHFKRRLRLCGGGVQLAGMEVSSYHDLVVMVFDKEGRVEMYSFEKLGYVKGVEMDFVVGGVRLVEGRKVLVVAGGKEIVAVRYYQNPVYKTLTEVQILVRITNESRIIKYLKLSQNEIFFGDSQGTISVFPLPLTPSTELQSVIYKNSYNSNRELSEQYHPSSNPPTTLPSSSLPFQLPTSHKISKRTVISLTFLPPQIVIIIYDTGYIKLYDKQEGFTLKGSIDVKQSFPELWEVSSNYSIIREEIQLILQVLEYLKLKDPLYEDYYSLPLSSHPSNKPIPSLTFRKTLLADPTTTTTTTTTSNFRSLPYSLRQVKRSLQRQREQLKNSQKYQHILTKTRSKERKSKRVVDDTKQILRFFNKDLVVGKKQGGGGDRKSELPESVKELEGRLNRIVEDYVSESLKEETEGKRRKRPLNVARRSTTKGKHEVLELEFLHTEIENEKLKRFSKSKSLSLPKLQLRPKAALHNI